MKIDCNPNPFPFGTLFTSFIESLNIANNTLALLKLEVKPTLNVDEWDFKVTFMDTRVWFQVIKRVSGAWYQKTTQMDYLRQLEVSPFRGIRTYVMQLLDAGVTDIKIDY